MTGEQLRFDIVPTALAVNAMRDNGYKNAAYAIAELFDNSIQAGAGSVELLCVEAEEQLRQRRVRRIRQIAVLDNGIGMDSDVLRQALQFGNGTRLDDRSGIGRFGMGLPSASISQCKKFEVWTWQSGPDDALYTYLDLREIERGEIEDVPLPQRAPVPGYWRKAGKRLVPPEPWSCGRNWTVALGERLGRSSATRNSSPEECTGSSSIQGRSPSEWQPSPKASHLLTATNTHWPTTPFT